MRDNIILKCTECGEENYINTKNKKSHPERVEFKSIVQDVTRKLFIRKRNKPQGLFFLYREEIV